MKKQKMIEYRREEVGRYRMKGFSTYDIAKVLVISQSTVARDVEYLEGQAREELRTLIQRKLPNAHKQSVMGIEAVLRDTWFIATNAKSDNTKLQALALISNLYTIRLNKLCDGNTINHALDLITDKSKELQAEEDDNPVVEIGHRVEEDKPSEEEVF